MQINSVSEWVLTKKIRIKSSRGGRAGTKSHDYAATLLIRGTQAKSTILCVREFLNSMEMSVKKLLINKINSDEALQRFYGNGIYHDCIVGVNGTIISFDGIKNAKNLKSFEGADICWVEEAQQLSQESLDTLIPTIRNPGSEIWFTWNPYSVNDPLYKFIVEDVKGYNHLDSLPPAAQTLLNEVAKQYPDGLMHDHVVTYLDNPFLSPMIQLEAELEKAYDIDRYNHIWLGYPLSITDDVIFAGYFENYAEFDMHFGMMNGVRTYRGKEIEYHYGIDFGFRNPTAIIKSFMCDSALYIESEIEQVEMLTNQITPKLKEIMPELVQQYKELYGDSARPDTIAQLSTEINIKPAYKGQNSVKEGIMYLKNFSKIYIHPRCVKTLYAFMNYKYKVVPKTGEILDEVVKKNDHLIDALRYSYSREIEALYHPVRVTDKELQQLKKQFEYSSHKKY